MPRRKQSIPEPQSVAASTSPPLSLVARTDTLLDASGERLLELHQEIGNALFDEMRSSQTEFMNGLRAAVAAWPLPRILQMQRQLALPVAAWLELTVQTQAALAQLLFDAAAERAASPGVKVAARSPNFLERRFQSVVINFPERRRAA